MILLVAIFGMFVVAAIAFQYGVVIGFVVCLPVLILCGAVGLLIFQDGEE